MENAYYYQLFLNILYLNFLHSGCVNVRIYCRFEDDETIRREIRVKPHGEIGPVRLNHTVSADQVVL